MCYNSVIEYEIEIWQMHIPFLGKIMISLAKRIFVWNGALFILVETAAFFESVAVFLLFFRAEWTGSCGKEKVKGGFFRKTVICMIQLEGEKRTEMVYRENR